MIFTYKIADVVFDCDLHYKQTYEYMKDYLAPKGAKGDFLVSTTEEDLAFEKEHTADVLPFYAYEYTAIYRKFIYELMKNYQGFFFHCSAISVNNQGVMFTAKSGTGKSTHRKLWTEVFGDKVQVVNDDKPIIRKINGEYFIYGTPFKGKEGMGSNICVKAKAICFLSRSENNIIGKMDTAVALSKAMNQTIRPKEPELMSNLLDMLDGLFAQVDLYDLRVNMSSEAPRVAYNALFGFNGGDKSEN